MFLAPVVMRDTILYDYGHDLVDSLISATKKRDDNRIEEQ